MSLLGPRILAYLKLGYFHKELEIDWVSLKSGGVFRLEQPHWLRGKRDGKEKSQVSSVLPPPQSHVQWASSPVSHTQQPLKGHNTSEWEQNRKAKWRGAMRTKQTGRESPLGPVGRNLPIVTKSQLHWLPFCSNSPGAGLGYNCPFTPPPFPPPRGVVSVCESC